MKLVKAKRRILLICTCILLAAAFVGCGKTEGETKENTAVNKTDGTAGEAEGNTVTPKPEAESEEVQATPTPEPKAESKSYYEKYQQTGEYPSLAEIYKDKFYIGVALSNIDINNPDKAKLVASQFSSLTCENEMKPDFILDRAASIQNGDEECPAINMKNAEVALKFAKENGLKMRCHTLVWHAQTPRWFFTEGYSTSPDAPCVGGEVMLARMENYIRQVMEYMDTNYPGVIYAWDVVNEAIAGSERADGIRVNDNPWYNVVGPDYVEKAFYFASKYVGEGQKLFYNDYGTYDKTKIMHIRNLVERMREQNIRIDGIGMQDHIGLTSPNILDYQYAINKYAEMGLEIQITELDIGNEDNSEEGQMKLAARYKAIFTIINNTVDKDLANITSVTFWGLTDDRSWLNKADQPQYPLLFDKELNPKPAFFAVAMDESIKMVHK